MAKIDWSRFRVTPEQEEMVRNANTRAKAARPRVDRKERKEFAQVTPDQILLLADAGDRLLLILMMLSGRRTARRADGWLTVPGATFQKIGLEDSGNRRRAIRRLMAGGLPETRHPGPGMALEYRLCLHRRKTHYALRLPARFSRGRSRIIQALRLLLPLRRTRRGCRCRLSLH